jgi:hypothetical protein
MHIALSMLFFLFSAESFAVDRDLEKRARLIVEYHCGACHISSSSNQKTKPQKIFDLRDGDGWFIKMSVEQLKKSSKMLEARRSLTFEEVKENFRGSKQKARKPTRQEIDTYSRFVDSVLKTSNMNTLFENK